MDYITVTRRVDLVHALKTGPTSKRKRVINITYKRHQEMDGGAETTPEHAKHLQDTKKNLLRAPINGPDALRKMIIALNIINREDETRLPGGRSASSSKKIGELKDNSDKHAHTPSLERPVAAYFVAQDMIWKTHIEKEVETAKRWPENWGFLTTPFTEVDNEEKEHNQKLPLDIPEHLRVRPATPVEEYIKVGPSPAVPQTTQGLIGWRSTVPSLQLERYGKSKHLKGDFCKRMKWPVEGIA
ncbi:PREDICTED: uncharacterized protein C20orf85 homolog [Nanorana parkeri]|uniref:uncharacterized protein C20orf85 homolog n=1 Tax=Nanorana parkeri TaxID=125878 RepID=UPI000854B85F|nr:PREDICTED: uncharacterized protein C20orf85 homolog [Nanorana parkeri]